MSNSDIEDTSERHPLSYKHVFGNAAHKVDCVTKLLTDITSHEQSSSNIADDCSKEASKGVLSVSIPSDRHMHVTPDNQQYSVFEPSKPRSYEMNQNIASDPAWTPAWDPIWGGDKESKAVAKNLPAAGGALRVLPSPGSQAGTRKNDEDVVTVIDSFRCGPGEYKDDEIVSPITTVCKHPLIHTQEPHVATTAPILDESALSDTSSPTMTPVTRKAGLQRPPPPTPPEAVSHDRLSMPTLPALHLTSTPALVERYLTERRCNPISFDQRTKEIKEDLIKAKLDRGGSSTLLENEYTVELASRLDAAAIEGWTTIRQHEHLAAIESDNEDKDANHVSLKQPHAQDRVSDGSVHIVHCSHHSVKYDPSQPVPFPTYKLPQMPGQKLSEQAILKCKRRIKRQPLEDRERYTIETHYKTIHTVECAAGNDQKSLDRIAITASSAPVTTTADDLPTTSDAPTNTIASPKTSPNLNNKSNPNNTLSDYTISNEPLTCSCYPWAKPL